MNKITVPYVIICDLWKAAFNNQRSRFENVITSPKGL